MRIVSLLPSATEIICQVGLGEYIVGVSHECDYPEFVKSLPTVTKSLIPKNATSLQIDEVVRTQLSTEKAIYHLNMDVLKELKPDFIITQSLCEVCAVAEDEVHDAICQLSGNVKVINLEPMTLHDVFETLILVGEETGWKTSAKKAVQALQDRVNKVIDITNDHVPFASRPDLVFLEWIDPPFNAGHWTPELIEYAGANSLLSNKHKPSMTIKWDCVVDVDPDVLFIACCGYDIERTLQDMPLLKTRKNWQELKSVKNKKVYLTDGNAYFSRPGPRLVEGLEIMANTLHPEIHVLSDQLLPAITYE